MASTGKKWLIGCGAGCGSLIVLNILVAVIGGLVMMRPMNEAVDSQKELNAQYGSRDDYRPPSDSLAPDRLERFLTVREAVMPHCGNFEKLASRFAVMDSIGEQDEEPSLGEVFKAVGGLTGGVFGMVGDIGEFTRARNEALLANGMGLGEYIWLYAVAYHAWLDKPVGIKFDESERGDLSRTEKSRLQDMTRAYGEALSAAGLADEGALWLAEADRMRDADEGVPFADGGLPAAATAALEPYRERLEAVYCAATTDLEMGELEKKGMSVHAD